MADISRSLDDIINDRKVRTVNRNDMSGRGVGSRMTRIGIEPSGDMRGRLNAKMRSGVADARQNLRGVKGIGGRVSSIKNRITAPSDNNSDDGDVRGRLNTIRSRGTNSLQTNKGSQSSGQFSNQRVQRLVNDIKSNKLGSQGSLRTSALLRTLSDIGGSQRLSRPIQFVGEEDPIEYEEVPVDYEDEPYYEAYDDGQYEFAEEEPEVVTIRSAAPVRYAQPRRAAAPQQRIAAPQQRARPAGLLSQPSSNRQNQQRSQNFTGFQSQKSQRSQMTSSSNDYVDSGNGYMYEDSNGIDSSGQQNNRSMSSILHGGSNQNNNYSEQRQSNYMNPWNEEPTQKRSAPMNMYRDEISAQPPKRQSMSSNLMSRLDQPQAPLLSSPGTKVMVSNLHFKVTFDDIKELFGNLGPLQTARMLQQGTAEVLFTNENDAYNAVKAYHNRLLDGQPMNVCVISNKPSGFGMSSGNSGGGMRFNNSQSQMSARQNSSSILKSARGRSTGYYL